MAHPPAVKKMSRSELLHRGLCCQGGQVFKLRPRSHGPMRAYLRVKLAFEVHVSCELGPVTVRCVPLTWLCLGIWRECQARQEHCTLLQHVSAGM